MPRGGANTGGNSKAARATRKYKRNGSGQFGSGPGTVHKGRGGKPHQSKGGPSAQKVGSPKNAGHAHANGNGVGGRGRVGGEGRIVEHKITGELMTERDRANRRNQLKQRLVGAAIGSAVLPGVGSYAGAIAGHRRATLQNNRGQTWRKYQAKQAKKAAKKSRKAKKR